MASPDVKGLMGELGLSATMLLQERDGFRFTPSAPPSFACPAGARRPGAFVPVACANGFIGRAVPGTLGSGAVADNIKHSVNMSGERELTRQRTSSFLRYGRTRLQRTVLGRLSVQRYSCIKYVINRRRNIARLRLSLGACLLGRFFIAINRGGSIGRLRLSLGACCLVFRRLGRFCIRRSRSRVRNGSGWATRNSHSVDQHLYLSLSGLR